MSRRFAFPVSFALRHRSFRRFTYALFSSQVGDWLQWTVLNWMILERTRSGIDLALINACRLVPVFLLSVPAGVWCDRSDRRRAMLLAQLGTLFFSGLLACGWVWRELWLVAGIVLLRSICTVLDTTSRNVWVTELVPKASKASAVSLNAATLHLARMVGPACAGMWLGTVDFRLLLWGAAVSTLPSIGWLMRQRTGIPMRRDKASRPLAAELGEALAYIRQNELVRSLLLLAVIPMVFGFPYTSMLPLFARELFHIGAQEFGWLFTAASLGAIAGTLCLSWCASRPPRWALYASVLAFGLFLCLFFYAPTWQLRLVWLFAVGCASQIYRTWSRICLQLAVPDELKGRILSIALMDRGLIPLGGILVGCMAEWAGPRAAGNGMVAGCVVPVLLLMLFQYGRRGWVDETDHRENSPTKRSEAS